MSSSQMTCFRSQAFKFSSKPNCYLNNLVYFSQIQLFVSTGIVSIKKKNPTTTTTNKQKHTKSPDRGFLGNKNIFWSSIIIPKLLDSALNPQDLCEQNIIRTKMNNNHVLQVCE